MKRFSIGLILLAACGGGEGDTTTTPDDQVVTTGGREVSARAHGHWQRAVELFDQYERQGWNDQHCSEVRDAAESANRAQSGAFAEAIYLAGAVKHRCGDPDGARAAYTEALQTDQGLCQAHAGLAALDIEAGNVQAGFTHANTAIEQYANRPCAEAYLNRAHARRLRNEAFIEVRDDIRRALAIDADHLPAFNELALLYLGQAQQADDVRILDLAELICDQARRIHPDYAPIYNTWGLIKSERGDVILALRWFNRARQLDDNMYEAHMNFGQITLSFRGYQDAMTSFQRAVQLQPNSYDAHIGLGVAYRGLNQVAQAEEEYNRALQIDANRPEAYFNLGQLYQNYREGSMTDFERAKQYYEQFLSKARGQEQYTSSVESVQRRCEQQGQRRNFRSRSGCRPGYMQVIDDTMSALREAAAIQAQAAAQEAANPPPPPPPPAPEGGTQE